MYRCVIIDDEPHAIEGLKNYIEKMPILQLIASYTDPVKALKALSDGEAFDLIFLDVDMPEINGIELAELIRNKTNKLVLTTAHTKYGYEAFRIQADDYLLKPYSLAKFMSSVQKIFQKEESAQVINNDKEEPEDFFFVKGKDDHFKLIKIRYNEVVSAESKLNYVQLHLTGGKSIMTYMSLTEISKRLSIERGFVQFQRSFILNKKHIEAIEGNMVIMEGGKKVSVGDYYKKNFNDFVSKYFLKTKRKG